MLDAVRAVEGLDREPAPDRPLVLTGLATLLCEAHGDGSELMRVVRSSLGEGRAYFSWKNIPLVFVVGGHLEDPGDGSGLVLEADERRWSLAPLLGTSWNPAHPNAAGWWWSPQLL